MRHLLLLVLAGVLSACGAAIRTSGALRILSVAPDVVAGCTVRAGDWMALKGNAFGTQAEWDAGVNYVLFPPGVKAEPVELTQSENPATLFFRVPLEAESGEIRVHVEGVGEAWIPVRVEPALSVQMAVPGCEAPTPPSEPQ
ncbi:hypothetical protein [Thermus oshimai]|uniref:hypothetical protein n=1 Tax=Thermus oshimai TaxID=56957 RepID=UPI000378F5C9|nr:hypothetical protein [Thermus oshimai]